MKFLYFWLTGSLTCALAVTMIATMLLGSLLVKSAPESAAARCNCCRPCKSRNPCCSNSSSRVFFLLSLGLLSGLMFVEDFFAQHLVHKTVLSFVAWCIFAVLFWGRYRFGWRGRTAFAPRGDTIL